MLHMYNVISTSQPIVFNKHLTPLVFTDGYQFYQGFYCDGIPFRFSTMETEWEL